MLLELLISLTKFTVLNNYKTNAMSIQIIRTYSHSDAIMLTAVSTLVENAITHKAIIIPKRATWAAPYLSGFKTRIDLVIKDVFGVDNAKELREATQTVNTMQLDALHKIGLINTEIIQDFKINPLAEQKY